MVLWESMTLKPERLRFKYQLSAGSLHQQVTSLLQQGVSRIFRSRGNMAWPWEVRTAVTMSWKSGEWGARPYRLHSTSCMACTTVLRTPISGDSFSCSG